jgi:hypothetical protein
MQLLQIKPYFQPDIPLISIQLQPILQMAAFDLAAPPIPFSIKKEQERMKPPSGIRPCSMD